MASIDCGVVKLLRLWLQDVKMIVSHGQVIQPSFILHRSSRIPIIPDVKTPAESRFNYMTWC